MENLNLDFHHAWSSGAPKPELSLIDKVQKNPLTPLRKQEDLDHLILFAVQNHLISFDEEEKRILIEYVTNVDKKNANVVLCIIKDKTEKVKDQNINKLLYCLSINLGNFENKNPEDNNVKKVILCNDFLHHIRTNFIMNKNYRDFDIENFSLELKKFFEAETKDFSQAHNEIFSAANKWKNNPDQGTQKLAQRILGALAQGNVGDKSIPKQKLLKFLEQYKQNIPNPNLVDEVILEIEKDLLNAPKDPEYQELCR